MGDDLGGKLFNMNTDDLLKQALSRPIPISSSISMPRIPTYAIKSPSDELIKIRQELEIANNQNIELQKQIKELGKPHTFKDVLLALFGAVVGVGLTILAVVLGWL